MTGIYTFLMFGTIRNRRYLMFILVLSLAMAFCGLDHAGAMGHGGSTSANCAAKSCNSLISNDSASPVKAAGFLLIMALLVFPAPSATLGARHLFLRPLFDPGRYSRTTEKHYLLHSVFLL